MAVPLARLLIRHGRGDEAIDVTRTLADQPGGAEDWIVDTLCTLNPALGRPRAASPRACLKVRLI